MKRALVLLLILLQLGAIGCGGGSGTLTQADLKKRAIRRKKDDDIEKSNVAANRTAAANTALSAANSAEKTAANANEMPGDNSVPAKAAPHRSTSNAATVALTASATVANTSGKDVASAPVSPTVIQGEDLPPIVQPPAQPLPLADRMAFAADNMLHINRALMAFVTTNLRYPPPAMVANGRPTLSWRVAILPLLGQQALYNQFKLDEPWNSPHNQQLLTRIPSVFQSAERFDEKTNFVLAAGTATVFPTPTKGLTPRQIDDGAADTAILLEVDDTAAIPWTKPEDITINLRDPTAKLGGLRGGLFLVGWADGAVTAVSVSAPSDKLKAMFTVDAGEPFTSAEVQEEIPTGLAVAVGNSPSAIQAPRAAAATVRMQIRPAAASSIPTAQNATGSAADCGYAVGPNTPTAHRAAQARLPVPDVAASKKSNHLIKTIFGKMYRVAKTPWEKRGVVLAMLDEARKVEQGSADKYALCRAGWKIAVEIGDYQTAEKFRLQLVDTYAVPDELELQAETVRKLSSARLSFADADRLLTTAQHAIDDAAHADDFDTALEMQEIAVGLARRLRDTEAVRVLRVRGVALKRLTREYEKISAMLGSVDTNDDAQANFLVGQYFCLFKGQWQRGLPLLAEGSDLQMRRLAVAELTASINAVDQVAVADGWWALSRDATSVDRQHLQKHAVKIYEQVLSGLEGLAKTKVNMRIDEFYREYDGGESRHQPTSPDRGKDRDDN